MGAWLMARAQHKAISGPTPPGESWRMEWGKEGETDRQEGWRWGWNPPDTGPKENETADWWKENRDFYSRQLPSVINTNRHQVELGPSGFTRLTNSLLNKFSVYPLNLHLTRRWRTFDVKPPLDSDFIILQTSQSNLWPSVSMQRSKSHFICNPRWADTMSSDRPPFRLWATVG